MSKRAGLVLRILALCVSVAIFAGCGGDSGGGDDDDDNNNGGGATIPQNFKIEGQVKDAVLPGCTVYLSNGMVEIGGVDQLSAAVSGSQGEFSLSADVSGIADSSFLSMAAKDSDNTVSGNTVPIILFSYPGRVGEVRQAASGDKTVTSSEIPEADITHISTSAYLHGLLALQGIGAVADGNTVAYDGVAGFAAEEAYTQSPELSKAMAAITKGMLEDGVTAGSNQSPTTINYDMATAGIDYNRVYLDAVSILMTCDDFGYLTLADGETTADSLVSQVESELANEYSGHLNENLTPGVLPVSSGNSAHYMGSIMLYSGTVEDIGEMVDYIGLVLTGNTATIKILDGETAQDINISKGLDGYTININFGLLSGTSVTAYHGYTISEDGGMMWASTVIAPDDPADNPLVVRIKGRHYAHDAGSGSHNLIMGTFAAYELTAANELELLQLGQLMAAQEEAGGTSPFDGTNMKIKHEQIYLSQGSTLQSGECFVSLPSGSTAVSIPGFWDVGESNSVVLDCEGQSVQIISGYVFSRAGNYFPVIVLEEDNGTGQSRTFVLKVGAASGENIGGGAYAEGTGPPSYYELYRIRRK
jgi:hypothetical protein